MSSNTASTAIAPEVRLFLAKVRQQLADLDPDDVAEITDGLEADLGELVAERGPASLGDPVEYAGELRLAAGLPAGSAHVTSRPRVSEVLTRAFDGANAMAQRQLDRLPGDARPLLAWLRPLWWLLRAWVATQLVVTVASAQMGGHYGSSHVQMIPSARGLGWAILIALMVASVQIGRGVWWPGGPRGGAARLIVIGVNLATLACVPMLVSLLADADSHARMRAYERGYNSAWTDAGSGHSEPYYASQAGIYVDGEWVSQIFPYDAQGNPLVGVQLFNQVGKPISVVTQPECESAPGVATPPRTDDVDNGEGCHDDDGRQPLQSRIYYPWTNGAAQLYNVFPLTSRNQNGAELSPTAFVEQMKPAVGALPFATVPPISLPGVETSSLDEAAPPKKSETARAPGSGKP